MGFHQQKTHGYIHLSTTPEDAPIVHFGGPLTLMGWNGETKRFRELPRGKERQLSILVGTPVFGSRREAFAAVDQDFSELAEAVVPTVDIEFPGKKPTDKPVRVRAKSGY